MNNKLNNAIQEFFKNTDAKDEKELNEQLQGFIEKYNAGEIEYEETPLDKAYEILERASEAKTEAQARRLAKEAYKVSPACLDAIIFLADLEDNSVKREALLNDGIKKEETRLKKEGFFDQENIGKFYGIFETRPYINALYYKASELLNLGKIKQGILVCKEILRLNEHDNTGVRYLLMAAYAYIEDEQELLALYKKYPEEHLEMLFPLFAYYYKQNDERLAKEYLTRINKANPNFLKFFKGAIKDDDKAPEGYYSHGGASEVIMYLQNYMFLIVGIHGVVDFILEYSNIDNGKSSKNNKKGKKSKK